MRGQIIAYVCDGGEVKYNRHEGASDIMSMLINRPHGCRYVVARVGDEYWTIDLYELLESDQGKLIPGHCTIHQTEKAAIVAALLTYGRSEL